MMEPHADLAVMATEERVGFVAAPGDPAALMETIKTAMKQQALLDEMGKRARALAETVYDRRIATAKFGDLLTSIGES
jgi:glycosyltransferase involved in cell wall biosynthesis